MKTNHRKFTRKSRLLIVGGGGSGGTGKTTISVALLDFFRSHGIKIAAYDAEHEPKSKGRLKSYYPDATLLDIHTPSGLHDAGSMAIQERQLTLVDLGAGAGPEVLEWLGKTITAFKKLGIPITIICPITDAPQVMAGVINWSNVLGTDVTYLLVLNDRSKMGCPPLERSSGVEFRASFNPPIVRLRYRNPKIYSKLEGLDLSPYRALELAALADQGDDAASERLGEMDNFLELAELQSDFTHLSEEFERVIEFLTPEPENPSSP